MRARINYKSKKTIIIISIVSVLLIAAIAGTVAFVKGNREVAAAMKDNEPSTSQNDGTNADLSNNGNAGENDENINNNIEETIVPEIGNNTNSTEGIDNNNEQNEEISGIQNSNATSGSTMGNTGANIPNQEYTQTTVIPGRENVLVEQNTQMGWNPISIATYTAVSKLNVHKPNLEIQKLAYLDGDSLEEAPVNTAVQKGEKITYVIKITNKGNEEAKDIRTIDTIPEGTQIISVENEGIENNGKIIWRTTIEAGATIELKFQVKVIADSITLIENTAKVNGKDTNKTQNPVITSSKKAEVIINKGDEIALEQREAKAGETIRYTITVKNISEVNGRTTITDKVPEGTTLVENSVSEGAKIEDEIITWNNIEVPAKGEVSVSFDVTINLDRKESVKNIAIVGGTPTEETETKVANITGAKAVDKVAAKVGETLTYTITLTNSGNANGTATVTDKIPEGTTLVADSITNNGTEKDGTITWTDVSVEAGKTATVSFKVTINADTKASVKNTAVVDGTPTGEVETNIANVKVTKIVTNVNELNMQGIDQITVKENDVVEYQITVENTGTVELTNVTITDELDVYLNKENSGEINKTLLTGGTLAVGETKTYIVYYKVTANDVKEAKQVLTNKANAKGDYTDGSGNSQTVTDEDNADVIIADVPGIEIIKTQSIGGKTDLSNTKVRPGDVINYTITIKNTGNTSLNKVEVKDSMISNSKFELTSYDGFTLENGILKIDTLARAEVKTITAKYTVQESDMKDTQSKVVNTATVSTSTTKPESSTVEVKTEVWKADISVEKSSELIKTKGNTISGKAEYGDTIKYTITAKNIGKKTGTINVTDTIPIGTELIPYAQNTTNLSEEELNKLATENGLTKTLTVNGEKTTSIYFTVKVIAKPGEQIKNTATASDGTTPSDPGNNVEKKVSVVTKTETPKITNSNVVIVLDVSGSMNNEDVKIQNGTRPNGTPKYEYKKRLDVAKDVVQDFINTINLPTDGSKSSISIVTFSGASYGNTSGTGYTKVLSVDKNGKTIANTATEASYLANTSVENLSANGGTCISGALIRAKEQVELLKKQKPQNQNVVIFVGDGKPEGDAGNISKEAANLKATGATVYAIGFTQNIDVLKNTVASSTDKYYTTSDDLDLSDVFTKIGSEITPTTPQPTNSENGLIALANIDISKDITIKVTAGGATKSVDTTGNYSKNTTDNDKFIKDKIKLNSTTGVYYLDLSKFKADDTVAIEYFVKEN